MSIHFRLELYLTPKTDIFFFMTFISGKIDDNG